MVQGRILEITTCGACAFRCEKYCPQEVFIRRYANPRDRLSLEDFKRYIDKVPEDVLISFAGFCEPFLNTEAVDMVLYAHKKGHKISIFTTLLGLTPEDIRKFKDIPFYFFEIHTPDPYNNLTIFITQNLKDTLFEALITIPNVTFSIMNDDFPTNHREDMNRGKPVDCGFGPVLCYKLHSPQPILLPDGRLDLCCMDFALNEIIGDLNDDDYNTIVSRIKVTEICKKCPTSRHYGAYIVRRTHPLWKNIYPDLDRKLKL